jgi:hypothetical protein
MAGHMNNFKCTSEKVDEQPLLLVGNQNADSVHGLHFCNAGSETCHPNKSFHFGGLKKWRRRNMRYVSSILVVLFNGVIAFAGDVAPPVDCAKEQANLFRLALKSTELGILNVKLQKTIAVGYDAASGGPGSGRYAQQVYLQQIEANIVQQTSALEGARSEMQRILRLAPQCFKAIPADVVYDISLGR